MNDNEIFIDDSIPLIRTTDKSYPMYFSDVRVANPNTGFPYPIRMDVLEPFHYSPVFPTDKPAGDVVTNGEPELRDDGRYYQTWVIRDYTEEEAKEILEGRKYFSNFNAVEVLRADREKGVSYSYGDNNYTLSLLETDLNALYAMQNHIQLNPDVNVKYRTRDGQILDLSPEQFDGFYDSVMESYFTLINSYWDYLTSMNSVTDLKQYPEEPLTFIK